MEIAHCARMLERGDPDRWRAALAAPAALRAPLIGLWALNLEIARAAWASREAALCEIRLQWWDEALAALASGEAPERHPALQVLAPHLNAPAISALREIVAARRADLETAPFADRAALLGYLDQTGGALAEAGARLCLAGGALKGRSAGGSMGGIGHAIPGAKGAGPDAAKGALEAMRAHGAAAAMARYLQGVAALRQRGRRPLPDDSSEAIRDLARDALERLLHSRRRLVRPVFPASRAEWQAARLLRLAAATPSAVSNGALHIPEFRKRLDLLLALALGRP